MMQPYHAPPFDSPVESDSPKTALSAIEKAIAKAGAEARQAEVTLTAPACDGHPIVYVGDGTACHEAASPSSGGQPALGVNLGGTTIKVEADLGRTLSPVVGYHGATPSLGGLPSTMDPGAADLGIAPVESAVTAAVEETRDDPGVEFVGATISGKTGDAKRLAVCYDAGGAGIWDDILSGSESAISGLSIHPHYIGAVGGGVYYLTRLYSAVVSRVVAGAETSTTSLPSWTGGGGDYAFSALATSHDRDTAAIAAPLDLSAGFAIYIGTSMLTAPSWATLALGTIYSLQVYGSRCLAFGHDGTLYVAAIVTASRTPVILAIAPPYSTVSQVIATSWLGTVSAGQWNAPSPLAMSRDGVYLAAGVHTTGGIVDIFKGGGLVATLTAPGYTLTIDSGSETGYGGIAWGPDGRLFAVVRRTSDGSYHLAAWDRTFLAPEIIDLSIASTPLGYDWVSVSGDGEVVAVRSWTDEIALVKPPYTAAGATVSKKTMTGTIAYQFEFDPSESYSDATGLTLTAAARGATPSGDAIQTVTRLAWTASSAVFALTITCPVPEGVAFISATDGGTYDSDARVVTWFLGTKTGGSSGYVELTTEVA